jgi:hypothetical protein
MKLTELTGRRKSFGYYRRLGDNQTMAARPPKRRIEVAQLFLALSEETLRYERALGAARSGEELLPVVNAQLDAICTVAKKVLELRKPGIVIGIQITTVDTEEIGPEQTAFTRRVFPNPAECQGLVDNNFPFQHILNSGQPQSCFVTGNLQTELAFKTRSATQTREMTALDVFGISSCLVVPILRYVYEDGQRVRRPFKERRLLGFFTADSRASNCFDGDYDPQVVRQLANYVASAFFSWQNTLAVLNARRV